MGLDQAYGGELRAFRVDFNSQDEHGNVRVRVFSDVELFYGQYVLLYDLDGELTYLGRVLLPAPVDPHWNVAVQLGTRRDWTSA